MSDQLRNARKQDDCPVWEVVQESLSEGDLYDILLEDGDPATIPPAIGLLSLGIGFANVEELLEDTALSELFRNSNPDVLALEETFFLICISENSLNQESADSVLPCLTVKGVNRRKLAEYLRTTRRFIHGLYARYYDQVNLDSFVDRAYAKYSRENALPSAALASGLLECMGSRNFLLSETVSINTRNQMILGVRAMKTFQKSIPEFHQSLENLFTYFT